VTQLQGLTKREFQNLFGSRSEGGRAGRGVGVGPNGLFHLLAYDVERDPQGVQRLGRDAFALSDETQQDVLGSDEGVVQVACLFLSEYKNSSGTVCKTFKQWSSFVLLIECTGHTGQLCRAPRTTNNGSSKVET
jgi:hypothetical protein